MTPIARLPPTLNPPPTAPLPTPARAPAFALLSRERRRTLTSTGRRTAWKRGAGAAA